MSALLHQPQPATQVELLSCDHGRADEDERAFSEAFRLKPRFAASTSVPRGGKLGDYAFELVIRACSEKCGSVSAELLAEQKLVFTRDKRFQLSPSLQQWSVTKVLAVQVEKVESAKD
jgi:hypothetical protein